MYNSDITDEEVKQFHRKVKVNATFTDASQHINTSEQNKVFPLFYCDKIEGNDNVRIVNNRLIIYSDSQDLASVNFISANDKKPDCGILHKIVTVNNRYFLKLFFYDDFNLNLLREYPFHINQAGGVDGDYVTDEFGNTVIELESTSGTFTITTNDGQTITWSEE